MLAVSHPQFHPFGEDGCAVSVTATQAGWWRHQSASSCLVVVTESPKELSKSRCSPQSQVEFGFFGLFWRKEKTHTTCVVNYSFFDSLMHDTHQQVFGHLSQLVSSTFPSSWAPLCFAERNGCFFLPKTIANVLWLKLKPSSAKTFVICLCFTFDGVTTFRALVVFWCLARLLFVENCVCHAQAVSAKTLPLSVTLFCVPKFDCNCVL